MAEEIIDEARALGLIRWLEDFLDADWIDDQLNLRARQSAAFGRWGPTHIHENSLINTIVEFRHHVGNGDAMAALHSKPGKDLVGHASNVHHVVSHLTPQKVDALKSLLRRPTAPGFLYQCKIAAHYLRDGFKLVSYSIGEERAGDVIVGTVGGEVELQCKALGPGAGRRINNQVFDDLAMRILNEADSLGWRGTVRLECTGRLHPQNVSRLAEYVAARMRNRQIESGPQSDYSIGVTELTNNVSSQEIEAASAGDQESPLRRPHLAVLGNRDEDGVRVLVTAISKQNDKIVGKMLATANAAAKQLDGRLPGVVCVHTPESVSWPTVAKAGVLDRHVTRGFRHFGDTDVAALVFTSENETGNAYAYRNTETRLPLPRGFRVVGESSAAK